MAYGVTVGTVQKTAIYRNDATDHVNSAIKIFF